MGGWQDYDNIFTLIIHNSEKFEIFPILFSSALNGKLDSRFLAGILEAIGYKYNNEYLIGETMEGFQIHKDVYYFDKIDENAVEEINKLRSKIYLESIDNRIEKFKWSFSNQDNEITFIP